MLMLPNEAHSKASPPGNSGVSFASTLEIGVEQTQKLLY